MKKILITGALIFMTSVLFAQGNLQFNQVKRISYTGTDLLEIAPNYVNATLGTITVPVGKVWKIESGSIYAFYKPATSISYNVSASFNLLVDNQPLMDSPIWLGAGNYIVQAYNPSRADFTAYGAGLSILEFNIVP